MNSIALKQNEQIQLERLAAQREIYSFAKRLHSGQIVLTVLLPITLFIVSSIWWQAFIAYSALFGIIAFVVDSVFITPTIKRQKIKAAKIQELFDCEVLELEKSPLKVATDVSVEEILLSYRAHKKIVTNIEKIRDWYPTNIGDLPISVARIICQRANCWWDSKLRIRYSNFLKYFAIVVILTIFVFAYLSKAEVTQLTLFLSGLIPFFQFCNKEFSEHHDAAKRLDELVKYSENIWQEAINNPEDYHRNTLNSRRLQDEIFEHRSKSPLILDKFYNLFRDQNETLMNRTSEVLTEEANEKLNKSC